MANNDFSNVNLDNLADVTETDFGDMGKSVDIVDVPVATKSIFDAERGNMEQVPIDFDEDDFNFAMRTQRDNVDKANFMGKTEIGDLSKDVDDYFALVDQESEKEKKQDVSFTTPIAKSITEKFLKETSFGKGIISFGVSGLESLPKGRIRKAETELEDLQRGYHEVKDLSVYKKYFAGDDSVLVDGELQVPTIQEKIDMTDEAKAERIAELQANINAEKALLEKSQNWFKDYELDPNAGEFDKFMYGLGNAGASVGYSFGVAAVTKNPSLASAVIAGSFGKLQLEETYEKARAKDVAPQRAEEMGLSTATVAGALEMFGFKWLEKAVKANTIFKRIAKGFMTEALQEGSQQAAVEAMESYYGIDVKTWDEIAADALYAAAIGGLSGGATGAVSVAFDRAADDARTQEILNEFVRENQNPISEAERSEILRQEIINRLTKANPELEEEKINNFAQDIVERANGSTTKAIMAINQVITKEVNFDTNDFTFDVWLEQVKKNLMKRGYTAEQIEEKAKEIRSKQDIKTGFSQVFEQAKADIEKGNLVRSEAEVEQAATLLAANAVGMHKGYGQGKTVLDYYKSLNVSFEKGVENRLQENPNAYATQPMAQELLPAAAYDANGKADINTPEFKAWFGDSKVVDEQGKPLVVYHFTNSDFDTFRKSKFGTWGAGIYLSASETQFASRGDTKMPLYVSMKNPYIAKNGKSEIDNKALEYAEKTNMLDYINDNDIDLKNWYLTENGYDGLIYKVGDEFVEIVAFNPNQIKSVYNRGTWSAASDNIYYQSAYAGSRVDYDQPSLEAIGSGEGAQAHGWGLYYALNRDVAEGYRETFTEDNDILFNGKIYPRGSNLHGILYQLKGRGRTVEKLRQDYKEQIADLDEYIEEAREAKQERAVKDFQRQKNDAVEVLDFLNTINETDIENINTVGGQVHEVDLPENPYLLDEDKLINEQSEYVRKSVRDMLNSMPDYYIETNDINNFGGMTGFSLYKELMSIAQRNGIEKKTEQKKFASQKLSEFGIKGITYDGGQDGRCFVIFDPKDVKVIQKFYQDNAGVPQQTGTDRRGEIERTAQGYVIRLFEQADPSTLLHEMWHLFTFQLQEAAKTSDRAKADWEVLANWSGYNQAITPEEKRAALERMARGGEQYLMKGKAPSNRLKFAFENFKQWLTDVYESIKNLNVTINYDVEKVFNRLVGGKSLDYAFVSEKTELGQELKRMRQKNIDAVVSGRYIISDQTQLREITGVERMKALTKSIIELTKLNKGKDYLLVISDNFGDQTIEDIGNLIKTTKMRLPRKGDTLYTKMIKEGGITKELDRQYDITGLMGLERNDKLVRKPTKKEKVIGPNGEENIIWSNDKPKPLETEEDLLNFLKGLKLLPELDVNYTYDDLDAEWMRAIDVLEKAPTTYLDNGARKIAEEEVETATRILEDIFSKPVSEIEEDYEHFLDINREFDIVSKDLLKDIRGLTILIERETNRLQRLIKKEALEDARAVRDDIIGLLERSIPAAQRSSFMKYISEIDTYERLISRLPKLVDRIVALQEKMFNDKIYKRIESVLDWSKSYKDSSGKRVSKFRDGDVQDFMDEANKLFLVKNKEKASDMIDKLLPNEETVMNRDNVFKVKLLQVASKLDGTAAETYLDVYNVLLDTYKAGKFAGEAERELRKDREKKLAETAYNVITKINPEEKGFKRDIKQGIKSYFYSLQGWEDLMDILSGGDKTSKEYQSPLSKAARVLQVEVAERGKANQWGVDLTKFVGEALGGKDDLAVMKYVNRLGEKVDLGTFETERETKWGKKTRTQIEMTKDQMIDFYMKWKDEGTRKAIVSKTGNGYTEEMANMIINNLSTEDLRVADALFDFYRSTRDEVFEAYRDEYGVSLGKVEFYSPRYREVNGDIESYFRGNVKAVSTGRVKERKDSATGAINFLGAFKTVDRYIAEVSHYTAWRKKMRDLNVIFGDKDVREAIRERLGNDIIKVIDKQIQDFATNGRRNAEVSDKIIDALRVNFTLTALSLKPAQTPKQITSIFAFMEYVPTKDFLKDMAYAITHFKEIKKILDESYLVKTRFANMQLEVNEMVNKHAVQRFIKSPKLQEFMMLPVQLGDIGAIYVGGWSVYAHALRQGKSKQEAMELFERAANSSQQSSYLSELSEWQRAGSLKKVATMFASSQNQYLRKELGAIRNLINGRVDKTTAVKRIMIYHFLLPMLFQWMSDLGRWDPKAQLRVALIGSLNGMFLIKDVFDLIIRTAQGERAFDQTLSIFGTINDLGKRLGKSFKTWLNNPDIEDIMESIKDLAVVGGETFGLPIGQLENLWEGATNVWEGNVVEGVEILAGWTPYAVENAKGGLPRDIVEAFK